MSRSWVIKRYRYIYLWLIFVCQAKHWINMAKEKTPQRCGSELYRAAEIGTLAVAWVHAFLGVKQTTFCQTNASSVNPANKSIFLTLSQIQHHPCTYKPLKSTFKQTLLLNLERASHRAPRSTQGEQSSQAVTQLFVSPQKISSLHLHLPCGVPVGALGASPVDPHGTLATATPPPAESPNPL